MLVRTAAVEDTTVRRQRNRHSGHDLGPGHHLLMTRAGPLDLLGALTQGRSYRDLLAHTIEVPCGFGLTVKVLDLSMLVRLKEELGREIDIAVLPILRRTLEERGREKGKPPPARP